MGKRIIEPGKERVLVIGGPANGQSHYINPGSDRLEVKSPVSEGGSITGKALTFVYKIRKLRLPDPVTNEEAAFRIAIHEQTTLEDAFNTLFTMYHQGQTGGNTMLPTPMAQKLWPVN